jgi:hypothetical protein
MPIRSMTRVMRRQIAGDVHGSANNKVESIIDG